ncbi:hypothetical protein GTA07_12930, partial [Rhodococcus hoagii]|nr:hypothetical protein [Prescottella equi]
LYNNGNYLQLRVQRKTACKHHKTAAPIYFRLISKQKPNSIKASSKVTTVNDGPPSSPELKRMAQERAQTEARLKKMGIAIDEDYQNPPIKALE